MRFPWGEVLFLVTCATIAGCDDYDEIADWGADHRDFLRGYGEFFFGTPKEDWLRVVLNRIDPALFEACFTAWAMSLRSDAPDLIALDGKRCAGAVTKAAVWGRSTWCRRGLQRSVWCSLRRRSRPRPTNAPRSWPS
jgi:hypothetical protein